MRASDLEPLEDDKPWSMPLSEVVKRLNDLLAILQEMEAAEGRDAGGAGE